MSITKKLLSMRHPAFNWEDIVEECEKIDGKFKDLERQLESKEQEIKQFILLEIEELKNIRYRTEVNGKAMIRCNKRIKELEQELKEKSDE